MRTALIIAAAAAAAFAATAARAAPPAPNAGPASPANTYGQHLLNQAMRENKGVIIMMMHVTPPGSKGNVVVASNIGRFGKKADPDDMEVITTGKSRLEINKAGDHFEVEEVLKDVSGDTIGALGVVWPYKPGDDQQAHRRQAEAIRDKLARRILHAGNLVDRWPYDPHFDDDSYAQALVDRTMAAHPEIKVLAIHATPPGSKTNVILGSNIGRIGKKADEDDLRVIDKGATNKEVSENGKRFEAELPLNDAHGRRIGALGVVLAYRAGEDKAALVAHAEKIRDEIAAHIASPASLVGKAS
jgi:hypothetical protein